MGGLRLVCRAAVEDRPEAVRIRRRLERAARIHLPAALDRAFEAVDAEHAIVDHVHVELELQVDVYDDVTLANLWADRIGAELRRVLEGSGNRLAAGPDRAALVAQALERHLTSGSVGPALATLLGGNPGGSLPGLLEHLGADEGRRALATALAERPALADRVLDALPPAARRRAPRALAAGGGWTASPAPTGARSVLTDAGITPGTEGRAPVERVPEPVRRVGFPTRESEAAPGGPRSSGRCTREEARLRRDWHEVIRRVREEGFPASGATSELQGGSVARSRGASEPVTPVRAKADPPAEGASDVDRGSPEAARRGLKESPSAPSIGGRRRSAKAASERHEDDGPLPDRVWRTRAGGVVLLHPWLADFLETPRPGIEPTAGHDPEVARRRLVLASVMGDADLFANDPLVRLLAGEAWERSSDAAPAGRITDPEKLQESAAALLERLAASLPGLADSSPGYLREHLLVRDGRLRSLADAAGTRLAVEPRPLDLLLAHLPYPLTPFRLPWTDPIQVTFRRRDA